MTWLPLPLGVDVGDLPAAPATVVGPDGVLLMTVGSLVVPFTTREQYAITARRGRIAVSGREAVTRERVQYQVTASRGAFVQVGRAIVRSRGRSLAAGQGSLSVAGNAVAFEFVPFTGLRFLASFPDVELSTTAQPYIEAEAGAFALTGSTAGWIPLSASYSQRSVWWDNTAATAEGMTNGITAETLQTGTLIHSDADGSWVQMDFGSEQAFERVVVGSDFANTLAGGWGKEYTENVEIIGSNNGTTWTVIGNTGLFTQALQEYSTPGASYRYVRLRKVGNYIALTEFYALR